MTRSGAEGFPKEGWDQFFSRLDQLARTQDGEGLLRETNRLPKSLTGPNLPKAVFFMALGHGQTGNIDMAEERFREALRLTQNLPQPTEREQWEWMERIWSHLAQVLLDNDKPQQLIIALEEIISLNEKLGRSEKVEEARRFRESLNNPQDIKFLGPYNLKKLPVELSGLTKDLVEQLVSKMLDRPVAEFGSASGTTRILETSQGSKQVTVSAQGNRNSITLIITVDQPSAKRLYDIKVNRKMNVQIDERVTVADIEQFIEAL